MAGGGGGTFVLQSLRSEHSVWVLSGGPFQGPGITL